MKLRDQLKSIRDFQTFDECAYCFQLHKSKLKPELQHLHSVTVEESLEPIIGELFESLKEIQGNNELLIHFESQIA